MNAFIIGVVGAHSPPLVRTLTSKPQICCAMSYMAWTDQGCSDGLPLISTCIHYFGQVGKRSVVAIVRRPGPTVFRPAQPNRLKDGVRSDGSLRSFLRSSRPWLHAPSLPTSFLKSPGNMNPHREKRFITCLVSALAVCALLSNLVGMLTY